MNNWDLSSVSKIGNLTQIKEESLSEDFGASGERLHFFDEMERIGCKEHEIQYAKSKSSRPDIVDDLCYRTR